MGPRADTLKWQPQFNDEPVTNQQLIKIQEALPDRPIVLPRAQRKVLVYSATAGARHGSIRFGKVALKEMGTRTGAYDAVVSDDPANFEPSALKPFAAVVLLNSTGNFFMPQTHGSSSIRAQFSDEQWQQLQARDKRLIGNLIEYVRQGGGLVGIHAATDAYYGNWEYRKMIGGTFWGHPWTANCNVTIVVEEPEHELMKPVFGATKVLQFKEEIYQINKPYSRDNVRVLLRLDPERSDPPAKAPRRTDNDFAVAWVRREGKGRVFYTSIGHNYEHYWNPLILRHYLSGIQFATGDLQADTTPSAQVKKAP